MVMLLGESRGVFAYRVFWEGFGEGGSGELTFTAPLLQMTKLP